MDGYLSNGDGNCFRSHESSEAHYNHQERLHSSAKEKVEQRAAINIVPGLRKSKTGRDIKRE